MRGGRDRRGRQAVEERPLISRPRITGTGIALALILSSPALAEPPSHRDELFTFSTVLATGRVVPVHCPDITVDRSGLEQLGVTLHITPTDLMAVQLQTRIFTKFYGDQADKAVAKDWCDDVYASYGPDGTLMRGFLHRR